MTIFSECIDAIVMIYKHNLMLSSLRPAYLYFSCHDRGYKVDLQSVYCHAIRPIRRLYPRNEESSPMFLIVVQFELVLITNYV